MDFKFKADDLMADAAQKRMNDLSGQILRWKMQGDKCAPKGWDDMDREFVVRGWLKVKKDSEEYEEKGMIHMLHPSFCQEMMDMAGRVK